MKQSATARTSLYSHHLWSTLAFQKKIVAQVGVARAMILCLKLLRAKGINLTCRLLEHFLPHRVECPCCGWTGLRFRTIFFGSYLRDDCGCPRCRSLERHRAYFLFYTCLELSERPAVLYFAPEPSLDHWLKKQSATIITSDLFAPGVHVRADLIHLPFKTASVDMIINHHVLEHVPDDFAALAEFERVLKPQGKLFISVPINETRTITWDWGFPDPVQQEHFREYGVDFPERLSRFDYLPIDIPARLPQEFTRRYGLGRREILYSCQKRSA